MGLTMGQRKAVTKAIATRYKRAGKAAKGVICAARTSPDHAPVVLDTDVASLSIKGELPAALLRELLGAQIGITSITCLSHG